MTRPMTASHGPMPIDQFKFYLGSPNWTMSVYPSPCTKHLIGRSRQHGLYGYDTNGFEWTAPVSPLSLDRIEPIMRLLPTGVYAEIVVDAQDRYVVTDYFHSSQVTPSVTDRLYDIENWFENFDLGTLERVAFATDTDAKRELARFTYLNTDEEASLVFKRSISKYKPKPTPSCITRRIRKYLWMQVVDNDLPSNQVRVALHDTNSNNTYLTLELPMPGSHVPAIASRVKVLFEDITSFGRFINPRIKPQSSNHVVNPDTITDLRDRAFEVALTPDLQMLDNEADPLETLLLNEPGFVQTAGTQEEEGTVDNF